MKIKTIETIVRENLCVRCGGCIAACPSKDTIRVGRSCYPEINSNNCTECGICLKVCPSFEINIPELYKNIFGLQYNKKDGGIGPVKSVYVGHSNDPEIRLKSSSGGIVTQLLLYCLNVGENNAVTVVSDHENPLKPRALLTGSSDIVKKSIGSKYTMVPINHVLRHPDKINGNITFSGLPCQIQSLRMWESINKSIKEKIGLTVSLLCHHNLEPEAAEFMLHKAGIQPRDVKKLSYRHNSWPGGIAVRLKDDSWKFLHGHTIKEAYNCLSKAYSCNSCLNCIDFCGEFADISVGDPWLRGDRGDYIYKDSRSLIIVRTERGERILQNARKQGVLSLTKIDETLFRKNFTPVILSKRKLALYRISKLKKKKKIYPLIKLGESESGTGFDIKIIFRDYMVRICRTVLFRNLYLGFCFSAYGDIYMFLKNWIKKLKHKFV
jgi:coenzyme F420 hydrogenase subunit beta